MRIRCLFLLLFTWHLLYGSVVDTALIQQDYRRALMQLEQGALSSAAGMAAQALMQLEAAPSSYPILTSQLYNLKGDCALHRGDYAAALADFEKAQQLLEHEQLGEDLAMADVLNKFGNYYQEIKDYEQALGYFEQTLELRKEKLGGHHVKVADVYNNIALCKDALGDYDKAIEYYDQSLAIRLSSLSESHPLVAQSYNNLGICWQNKGEKQLALSDYERAIRLYSQLGDHYELELADVYLNIGTVYSELGNLEQFLAHQQKALRIYLRKLHPEHAYVALCYNNMANAYAMQEDYQQALVWYERALAIRKKNHSQIHPDVAETYFNRGWSYFLQGQTQFALADFEHCLRALNYEPGGQAGFEQVNDHGKLIQAFTLLAEIWKAQYEPGASSEVLLRAFNYYQQADQLFDFVRVRYETVGSKLTLASSAHRIYDAAIALALDLYRLSGDDIFRKQAFQYSEKNKGILLLEGLKRAEADAFAGVPADVLEEVKALETEIGLLEKQQFLMWEQNPSNEGLVIDSLNNLIFEKKQLLSGRIAAMQERFPAYYNLRYETNTISIEEIQQRLLQPEQTMVAYFLGQDYLQVFVIKKDDFQILSIKTDSEFYLWLNTFQYAIRSFPTVPLQELQANMEQYASSAFFLYQNLIAPIQGILTEDLIIIPDAELSVLPFGALLTEYPEELTAFKSHAYLIKDYALSYNFSATLLDEMSRESAAKKLLPYLGVAPEFKGRAASILPPLTFTAAEVEVGREVFGGHTLLGGEATKSHFLEVQSAYAILHLATHGKANESSGDFSFLAFSMPEDLDTDEMLFVKELYNMSTQAELVVLSACETGIGELQVGEGISSIARSFSYAGARSILATQWTVNDQASRALIALFFEHIKQGLPKNEALRQAKLSYIQSGGQKTAHPYYWSSFMPFGNMEKLELNAGVPLAYWWGGVLVLLVFSSGYFYYRRNGFSNRMR